MKERKVAVFRRPRRHAHFGQVPHYLSEESMYDFAVANYQDRQDKLSKEKWKICEELAAGDNVAVVLHAAVHRLLRRDSTPDELSNAGWVCYQDKFAGKFYPEMKELLANLEEYGFEIWIVTASTGAARSAVRPRAARHLRLRPQFPGVGVVHPRRHRDRRGRRASIPQDQARPKSSTRSSRPVR